MKKLFLISQLFLLAMVVPAQEKLSYYLPSGIIFNQEMPTPASVIGHEVGEWHVTHDKLLAYMKLLAEKSDRAVWEEYGKSWEGRPLGNLIISSPENILNLEKIRTEHLKLSDPALSASVTTADMPVIIKLGYGVHGNESSAQNASMLSAYYLIAGEGEEIEKILKNAIILIDPSLNPDGQQRHSTWVNMYRGVNTLNPDPASREFSEAWPGGRTNHYWFDLNRDYIMLQQSETVGRVEAFHRWMPNINTDHHEMGANATFFFQPGIQTRNNPVVPIENQEVTTLISKYHAKYLDGIGSLYYTEESYDDFYLGKGSAYPDIHGSIGILFEQPGVKGHLREVSAGTLSFPFAIRNQFTVTLSTIEAGLDMRVKLLDMQRDFYRTAIREAEASPIKGYLFTTKYDRAAGSKFIENLLRHKIEVYTCGKSITKNGESYSNSDSYFVPTKQKEYRFVRSLFETITQFKDTTFYDISTWILPMSFNISYTAVNAAESTGITGLPVTVTPPLNGRLTGAAEPYAWLFEWNEYYTPKALYMLQKAGLVARVATKRFTLTETGNQKKFNYGTIMVHPSETDMSGKEVTELMSNVAEECGIEIYGASTGLTSAGIDLGSNEFIPLTMPSVLMLIDEGIPSDDAGEIWYLMDLRYGMPVTMMPASRLMTANLSRYNVIIIAGNPSMSSLAVEQIRDWNRSGGTLIAYKGGNKWVANNKFAEISFIDQATLPAGIERRYTDRANDRNLHTISGSIFETKLDLTHPMCYGYIKPLMPVFKSESTAVRKTENLYNNPVTYTEKPLLSGYSSPENIARIKNSAFVSIHSGSGRVISIYDDTNFRVIWYGTSKIFANAVFFGQILRQESRYGQ
ncbi:MAG TPA: M14 family metallopeptidase [Bacteroidales bacterium]|nr:M14 family metallopeptidase [Bacteroidales bacterium]